MRTRAATARFEKETKVMRRACVRVNEVTRAWIGVAVGAELRGAHRGGAARAARAADVDFGGL